MIKAEHPGLESLLITTHPIRDQIAAHDVYESLRTLEEVRFFMKNHVFAVWDFMGLVKVLQPG